MNCRKMPWPSLVACISDAPSWTRIPSYLFLPCAPFMLLVTSLLEQKQWSRWVLRGLEIAFTLAGLSADHFLIGHHLHSTIGGTLFNFPGGQAVMGVILTCALNMFLHVLLLLLDYPMLIRAALFESSSAAVSRWACTLYGRDIWGGNTSRLLEILTARQTGIGGSGEILVDFIRRDIERKVRGNGSHENDDWTYKVTVTDWDARTYSRFLADNITSAKKSILWMVDPRDFLSQVLPAHIFEVVLSLGCEYDHEVAAVVGRLQEKTGGENPCTLLGTIRQQCPNPCRGDACMLPGQLTERCNWQQIRYFDETEDSRMRRMYECDHVLTVLFCHILQILGSEGGRERFEGSAKGITSVRDQRTAGFGKVWSWYQKRVGQGLATRLDHIEAFHRAPCREKKRHLYVGTPQGAGDDETLLANRCRDNLKSIAECGTQYFARLVPIPRSSSALETDGGLIEAWSLLENDTKPTDAQVPALRVRELPEQLRDYEARMQSRWEQVPASVRRVILDFALSLFAQTSGGEENVQAVFDSADPLDDRGQRAYDRGLYDDRIEVVSSERSTPDQADCRTVTWSVYGMGRTAPTTRYFKGQAFVLSRHLGFGSLKRACMEALCQ